MPSQKQRAKRAASPTPVAPSRKRTKVTAGVSKPYLNSLPNLPAHERPPLLLFGWGINNFGMLGVGPVEEHQLDHMRCKPSRNQWVEHKMQEGAFGPDSAGLEAVAAGGMHSLFIDETGQIWSCGQNDDGALGRITEGLKIPDPKNSDEFLGADCFEFTPALVQSLFEGGFRAVKIAAGNAISAAISSEGELRAWGSYRDSKGSVGFSSKSRHQYTPTAIIDLKQKRGDMWPEKFVSVAAGSNHLLILTTHGSVYTVGANEDGQLGRSFKSTQRRKINGTIPEKVVLGTRPRRAVVRAVVVGAGSSHSFAVDTEGDVWGWGLNSMGQTGTGINALEVEMEAGWGVEASVRVVEIPTKVLGLSKGELGGATVIEIAGGEEHTVFLTSDGRVYACGSSRNSALGLADDDPAFENRPFEKFLAEPARVRFPKQVDDDDPIVHISVGSRSNLALTKKGAMYAWGQQNSGELGIGQEPDTDAPTPTVVVRREGSWTAEAIACGASHSLGLLRRKM